MNAELTDTRRDLVQLLANVHREAEDRIAGRVVLSAMFTVVGAPILYPNETRKQRNKRIKEDSESLMDMRKAWEQAPISLLGLGVKPAVIEKKPKHWWTKLWNRRKK